MLAKFLLACAKVHLLAVYQRSGCSTDVFDSIRGIVSPFSKYRCTSETASGPTYLAKYEAKNEDVRTSSCVLASRDRSSIASSSDCCPRLWCSIIWFHRKARKSPHR